MKIDEFETPSEAEIKARIDAFIFQMQNDYTHQGYIINYGTKAQVAEREKVIKSHLAFRKFPPDRIIFADVSATRLKTQLWSVPPGADLNFEAENSNKNSGNPDQNTKKDQIVNKNQNSSVVDNFNSMGFPKIPLTNFLPKTAEDWFKLGFGQSKERKYQDAIASYSKAIELKADLVAAYQNCGLAYGSLNKIDSAIADFTKAIELQPKNGVYYRLRSIGYCSQGKKALAQSDETQAVKLGEKIDKPCK